MSPALNITANSGSVTKTLDKTVYIPGEKVIIGAVADDGYEFAGWSEGLSGKENPVKIIMHANRSIIANFVPITFVPENVK